MTIHFEHAKTPLHPGLNRKDVLEFSIKDILDRADDEREIEDLSIPKKAKWLDRYAHLRLWNPHSNSKRNGSQESDLQQEGWRTSKPADRPMTSYSIDCTRTGGLGANSSESTTSSLANAGQTLPKCLSTERLQQQRLEEIDNIVDEARRSFQKRWSASEIFASSGPDSPASIPDRSFMYDNYTQKRGPLSSHSVPTFPYSPNMRLSRSISCNSATSTPPLCSSPLNSRKQDLNSSEDEISMYSVRRQHSHEPNPTYLDTSSLFDMNPNRPPYGNSGPLQHRTAGRGRSLSMSSPSANSMVMGYNYSTRGGSEQISRCKKCGTSSPANNGAPCLPTVRSLGPVRTGRTCRGMTHGSN
eukprot:comp14512_c0_seq1/m.10700 comp14512_c0_seq1/g.10700  ORF comp14512_c0_seq1/g.10700 comp14512_c0_seq1/m.10700 type:complete len:357 (-) comp14512_c0_seq1:228-1298(-)